MKTATQLVQEARLYKARENPPYFGASLAALERFAALVRADEREACAKICEKWTVGVHIAEDIRARSNT